MQEFSVQTTTNLKLVFPSNCSIGLSNWRTVASWVYEVCRDCKFDHCITANALMLLSRHSSDQQLELSRLQLYAIVCIYISSGLFNAYSSTEKLLFLCNGCYTMKEFIKTRNEVMRDSNGRLRIPTTLDILPKELQEARFVGLLCYIWHPKFTTFSQDKFASACVDSLTEVCDNNLTEQVVSCMFCFENSDIQLEEALTKVLSKFSKRLTTTIPFEEHRLSFRQRPISIEPEKLSKLGTAIGSGMYSVVYLSDTNRAIKVQEVFDEAFVELSVLSTYKHENLVEIFGFFVTENSLRIEMELGVSLESLRVDFDETAFLEVWNSVYMDHTRSSFSNITLKERRSFSDDIARGVSYLHSVGILHNDLKPANVIIVEQHGRRVAKLIDFSVSELMILNPQECVERAPFVHCTPYKCPELLLDKYEYCFGPDIWATGVLMLFLETGVEPFLSLSKGNEEMETLRLISIVLGSPPVDLYADYPFPGRKKTGLTMIEDKKTKEKILRALDYDPKSRSL